MAFWLFKTEPETFSWADRLKAGAKGEEWSGVRNALAQKHMRAMKVGGPRHLLGDAQNLPLHVGALGEIV
jgi:predicted RNA-binding protein with PUA-like domain